MKNSRRNHKSSSSTKTNHAKSSDLAQSRPPPQLPVHNHLSHGLRGLVGALITLALLVFAAKQADYPFWPTDPDVHPTVVNASDPLIFPFSIKNRSILFDMENITIECHIDFSQHQNNLTFKDMTFSVQTPPILLPATKTLNQYCAYNQTIFKMDQPLQFISMRIFVEYDTWVLFGSYRRKFSSAPFTWSTNAPQWVEGPAIGLVPKLY